MANSQKKLTNKTTKQVEEQLTKYYSKTAKQVIKDFENTYEKLLNAMEDGKQPTPANLYKLDKYWQAQAQARIQLEKLGEKQIVEFTRAFESNFFDIYNSIALKGGKTFNSLDTATVNQMINQIWCADGKNWSSRVWGNTNKLLEELNEGLIHCVAAGKKTTDLKNILQDRFDVSYSRADAIVRTELAHIQTQAAVKRYEDYGVQQVEVWADADERRCEICGKLHKTKYPVGSQIPIPAHTNCRCCILPVVE